MDCFTQTFLKYTALNPEAPECKNLVISALVRNLLPGIKREIQSSVIGWIGQSLNIIIEAAMQFFKNSLQENKRKKE